jgi:hypothetical protein
MFNVGEPGEDTHVHQIAKSHMESRACRLARALAHERRSPTGRVSFFTDSAQRYCLLD